MSVPFAAASVPEVALVVVAAGTIAVVVTTVSLPLLGASPGVARDGTT